MEEEEAVAKQMAAEAVAATSEETAACNEERDAWTAAEAATAESEAVNSINLTARRLQSLSQEIQKHGAVAGSGLSHLAQKVATVSTNLHQQVAACTEACRGLEKMEEERAEAEEVAQNSEATCSELQEQVRLLMVASSAACELRNAEASLVQGEEELAKISEQLESQSASCNDLLERRRVSESTAETEELLLSQLQSASQALEANLQRAEARLHTQERRFQQERNEWKQRLRQLQQLQLREVQTRRTFCNRAVEPVSAGIALEPVTAVNMVNPGCERLELQSIAQQEHALEEQAKDLQSQLAATKRRGQMLLKEHDTERYLARRGEDVLTKEIASARGRVTAMSYELDRLHQVTCGVQGSGTDTSKSELRGQSPSHPLRETSAGNSSRSRRSKLKQLQSALVQEHEQGRQLRDRVSRLKNASCQMHERIRDAEQRLHVSRDDVERKRALAITLQKRRQESAEQSALTEQQEEDCSKSLQQLRSDIARKDAAIKTLQREVTTTQREEIKQERDDDKSRHESARSRMQVELHRKEQQLHHARAKAQFLKTRLESEAQTARRVRRSVGVSSRPGQLDLDERKGPSGLGSIGFGDESPWQVSQIEGAGEQAPGTLPLDSDVLECSPSSGLSAVQDLSGILLQAADSSWELSTAVRESLQILNLQPEDLAEFLPQTECAEPAPETGFAILS